MLKFIEQLQAVAENPTNPLHGKIAWDNLGAAGHSRGAKIAAMHFAGGYCGVPLNTSSVVTVVLSLPWVRLGCQPAFCTAWLLPINRQLLHVSKPTLGVSQTVQTTTTDSPCTCTCPCTAAPACRLPLPPLRLPVPICPLQSITGTTPNVRAAYLVDPVDGFAMTKSMLGYPSAVKLLRDRSMKLGITGKSGGQKPTKTQGRCSK